MIDYEEEIARKQRRAQQRSAEDTSRQLSDQPLSYAGAYQQAAMQQPKTQKAPKLRAGSGKIRPDYFSYNKILNDIDALRNMDMSGPNINYNYREGVPEDTYTLEDLRPSLEYLQDVNERFQTPEQVKQFMDTWLDYMQPYLDTSQQQAQRAYQQQLDKLRQDWSSRGLMQSPAAALNELYAASQFGQDIAHIQNQATMDALAKSLAFGQLGLQEQATNIQQQEAALNALLDALGVQEDIKMNIINTNRMQAQDEFLNWLAKTDLTIEQKKAVIDSMFRGAELESANQGTSFQNALSKDALNLERWRSEQDVNTQLQQNYLDNLYRGMQYREAQRQFNFQNALNWSKLFGRPVRAVGGGDQMYAQVKNWLTPEYESTRAGIAGVDPVTGKPTFDARKFAEQMAFQREQLAQEAALAREQMALQRELARYRASGGGGYGGYGGYRRGRGLTPYQQFLMSKYFNDPQVKYGEAYPSLINSIIEAAPQTPEERKAFLRKINGLHASGYLNKQGYNKAKKTLNAVKPPAKGPSAFQKFTKKATNWLKKQIKKGPRRPTGRGLILP